MRISGLGARDPETTAEPLFGQQWRRVRHDQQTLLPGALLPGTHAQTQARGKADQHQHKHTSD